MSVYIYKTRPGNKKIYGIEDKPPEPPSALTHRPAQFLFCFRPLCRLELCKTGLTENLVVNLFKTLTAYRFAAGRTIKRWCEFERQERKNQNNNQRDNVDKLDETVESQLFGKDHLVKISITRFNVDRLFKKA